MTTTRIALIAVAVLLAGYPASRPALGSSTDLGWACSTGDSAPRCVSTALAPMSTPRGRLAAVTGPDRRIYAIGGDAASVPLHTVEAYDSVTGRWLSRAPMPTARFGVGSTVGLDGRIYVAGGAASCNPGCTPLATVEVYDAGTNTWASVTPMTTARFFPTAATGPDGRIYVMGGFGLSSAEAYDARTGRWSTVAPMHSVRFAAAAVTGSDGLIYVMGGSSSLTGVNDLDSVEAYDFRSNTWRTVAPMLTRRSALAAALGPDGRIYAIGGSNNTQSFLDTVEAYDPAAARWTTAVPLPTARFSLAATTGPDGRIYAIGGFSPGGPVDRVEAYAPLPSLPQILTPGPPLHVNATAGSGSATLTWSPPPPSGGGVTGYTVTVYAGSTGTAVMQRTVAADTTSVTLTGLTNGETYTFTVSAQNTAGSGPESARSNAVTPGTVPVAPGSVHASAGDGRVTVSWSAPVSTGGREITGYTVTAYVGSGSVIAQQVSVGAGQTTTTLTGLTPGNTYSFAVSAQNSMGSSGESARSNLVALAGVPDAPGQVRAVPMIRAIAVTWTAPQFDGASPITRYIVSVLDVTTGQTIDVSVAGTTTSTTLNGLANGHTYVVSVRAVNATGTGAASVQSNAVSLPTTPDAPTNVQATPGDGAATVTWRAPGSTGGAAITSYIVTASDGAHSPISATSTTTSATLTGLTNDVTYSIAVSAVNAAGQGPSTTATTMPRNLPPVVLPLQDLSVQYSDQLSFDVTATDAESGDHLTLSVSGIPAGLTFVDRGNGHGTVSGTVSAVAGTYPVTVSASDGHNPAVVRMLTITVVPETATISLSPGNPHALVTGKATTSGAISLVAVIGESGDATSGTIASAAPVACTLTGLNSNVAYSETATISPGSTQNTLTASCRFSRLPVDEYHVSMATSGERYKGSAETMLAVYRVTKNVLRASGSLLHDGAMAEVTAATQYSVKGRLKGSVRYVEHRTSGDVTVASVGTSAMVVRNRHVYVQGTATVNGVGGYRFVASFVAGSSSEFALWVTDPTNQTVPDLTFAPVVLASGKVTTSRRP